MCAERGVHVVVGGPYNSGLLAGGRNFEYQEAPPAMVARRDRIASICERHGADIRSAALQFCAVHPVVAAIIPGAKRPEKVEENARLMAATIGGVGEPRNKGLRVLRLLLKKKMRLSKGWPGLASSPPSFMAVPIRWLEQLASSPSAVSVLQSPPPRDALGRASTT